MRWALVSTGPRSLMATISISVRPDSTMARRMLRPMRPNPLMATRTVMELLLEYDMPDGRVERRWALLAGKSDLKLGLGRFNNGFGRNTEVLVELVDRAGGTEVGHADEPALVAEELRPAHFD